MKSEEIEKQMQQLTAEIERLRLKRSDLLVKFRDAKQAEFEQQHNIKSGDQIATKKGTPYYYDKFGIDCCGHVVVFCHPVKKDGTASGSIRHIEVSDFQHLETMVKRFINFQYAAIRTVRQKGWSIVRGHIQFNMGGTVSVRTLPKKFHLPEGDIAVLVELASGTKFVVPMKAEDLKEAGYDMLSQHGELCNIRAKPESYINISNQINGFDL